MPAEGLLGRLGVLIAKQEHVFVLLGCKFGTGSVLPEEGLKLEMVFTLGTQVGVLEVGDFADQLHFLLPVVHYYGAKVWVLPRRGDRVLVVDQLGVFLLHAKLEQEGLGEAIFLFDVRGEVDQRVYLLLAALVPIRAHEQGLLRALFRLGGQVGGHICPACLSLLVVDQTKLLARVANGQRSVRPLRILELVQETGLLVQLILGLLDQRYLF